MATPPLRKTPDRHVNNSLQAKAPVSPLRDTNKVEKDQDQPLKEPQFPTPPSRPTSEAGSSIRTASPPPPPPPTGMTGMEVEIEPSPLPPPPGPPVSRVHHRSSSEEDEEDDDEEILRVTSENGNVELAMSSKAESPIVPSVIGKYSPSNSAGSSEENPSADDEGSHGDGDEKATTPEASNSVDCTPRTKKKVEHFRQGLAARRIQRTWKHFYEELEERKDVRNELPAPLVQGTFL